MIGLEDRVDDFMRPFSFDDGQWHFKTRDMKAALPVTEQQVNEAEENFRFRYKIATAGSWLVVLGMLAWTYVQVFVDDKSYWLFLVLLPAWYVSFLFYFWANMSATSALRRRLLDLNVRRLARTKGPLPSWAKLPPRRVLVRQLAACWAILLFFGALSLWDYRNNVRALHGVSVSATVIEPKSKQQCLVSYEYQWAGQTFGEKLVDCRVMQAHPIGSSLSVRVDPTRPGHSILPGQSPWPPEALIPVIGAPFLLLITVAL